MTLAKKLEPNRGFEPDRLPDRLNDDGLDLLFREARTYRSWLNRPVADETLRELYELVKLGPTSSNCCPARILFLRTPEAKAKLLPCLDAGNVQKTKSAPVTAILGYDLKFYEKLPKLFPNNKDMRALFADNPELIQETAFRNATLEGGYFILAARSLGLDCGPMSGFDNEAVDREFFCGPDHQEALTQEHWPSGHVRSNFICNLGYGDSSKLPPRLPRLDFEEACRLL